MTWTSRRLFLRVDLEPLALRRPGALASRPSAAILATCWGRKWRPALRYAAGGVVGSAWLLVLSVRRRVAREDD